MNPREDNLVEKDLPSFEEVLAVVTKLEDYNQQLNDLVNAIDLVLRKDFGTEHGYCQFATAFSDMKAILCCDLPWLLSDVARYYRSIADLLITGVPPDWYRKEHPDWREKQIQMVKKHLETM